MSTKDDYKTIELKEAPKPARILVNKLEEKVEDSNFNEKEFKVFNIRKQKSKNNIFIDTSYHELTMPMITENEKIVADISSVRFNEDYVSVRYYIDDLTIFLKLYHNENSIWLE